MSSTHLRRVVIVGGGTAGWMCAAALSKLLLRDEGRSHWRIQVVESDDIGTIGVGEATIPSIRSFNAILGIDEDEFLRETQGTFKLGIEFVNWGAIGESYFHGFGNIGQYLDGIPFHQHWLRLRHAGRAADFSEYSINTVAPKLGRFMRPRLDMAGSPISEIGHAFHFDAGLYARYLRSKAEALGVVRLEGRIEEVSRHPHSGGIASLRLTDGAVVEGDFFVDCSGMRALLIGQTLEVGYEDWSHWLPCDRAQAIPTASTAPLLPFTRCTALDAGWQWRIPLQHRTGNGHVYSSSFVSDSAAEEMLLRGLESERLAAPRVISFRPGRRKSSWVGNCVAIGLASGFLEPLESTSIALIQSAITRLLEFFPHSALDEADIAQFNRETQFEVERIRDFIILHYKVTQRSDTEFWAYCKNMSIPDTLVEKMSLFASNGRVRRVNTELFREESWVQVMLGQGLIPRSYHPIADVRSIDQVHEFAENTRDIVGRCAMSMPMHAAFIATHCAAA